MSDLEAIPIDALFDLSGTGPNESAGIDVRGVLEAAEVIIGRDVMSGREFILYGREKIQRIAEGTEPAGAVTLCIALDQDPGSGDIDRLTMLVAAVKGRHDYRSFDGT
ncbi:MAG TPA: hypothetical protein VL475_06400 [Planctomycetaceae bacterium]|nr:hypothetical protein [Planctomycetaceae bacterium]